ncbi:hypothetical protein GCM10027614_09820 [Micromonospora vulcania]
MRGGARARRASPARRGVEVLLGADGLRQVHDGAADELQPRPAGRRGLVTTRIDRSLGPQVTTRIGLAHEAIEVTDDLDLRALVRGRWADGERVDYLICDEACFYTVEHVEQMAELVDSYDVDVFAFGLATDFRSCLFPAAQRLLELADEVARIQVEVLCWCGREGLLNARVVDGRVVREGAQVVIGDTVDTAEVRYQVLCRRHYRSGDLGPRD